MKMLTLKEEILFNIKKCLGEELRAENSNFSSLYSINLKQVAFLKKHYKLEFNNLFLNMFCFFKSNFSNKLDELHLFKNHNIIIRLSSELSSLNYSNLNDFLYKYTNSSEFIIFKNKELKQKKGFFLNREIKHPIKLFQVIRAEDQHLPPYNDFYYLFKFHRDNELSNNNELSNKIVAIGNNDFSFSSIIFN
jgi:hypothetical protein